MKKQKLIRNPQAEENRYNWTCGAVFVLLAVIFFLLWSITK